MTEVTKTERKQRMLLGLAIMEATLPPGAKRTAATIAAFCGCSLQSIQIIERKALEKLRREARRQRHLTA